MANTIREGRGETTGPAGSKVGVGGTVETSDRTASESVAVSTESRPTQIYLTAPLIYDFRTKGKKRNRKRKKYSRGLKTLQRTEDGLTLAGRRFGDALESGFRTYRRKRNKSARRKKDGSLRDILPNSADGLSRFINVGSDIPYDVARRVNSKKFGKQVRDTVQFFARPFFR